MKNILRRKKIDKRSFYRKDFYYKEKEDEILLKQKSEMWE